MFPEGNVLSTFMFLLLLTTGVRAEKICSVLSNHEVHMGSSFQIYCIFRKECNRLIYRDEVSFNYSSLNSTVVIMSIVNLTRTTTFTCKCQNEPEPCGTDIVPGYPPAVPQNLTCIQEGEFGSVHCTWKTGWETYVKTTSHLWVQGAPTVSYESVAVHEGTRSALFAAYGTQSNFSVWIHTSNSLGSANSTVLNFVLNEIVKPLSPKIAEVECSSRRCQLCPLNKQSVHLVEIRYEEKRGSWNTVSFNNTNLTTCWTVTSLNPYNTYTFEVRWKPGPRRGLWSEWTRIEGVTDEEAPMTMLDAWYIEESTQTVSKSFQLFWRELNNTEARGKITQYIVTVIEHRLSNRTALGKTTKVSCSSCNVSISAMNSKGLSPARLIHLQPITLLPYKVSQTLVNNHSVALSWPRPIGADPVTEFLVEWFPEGRKQQLQWVRVERHLNTAHITGLQPAECYEGAVVYLNSSKTKKATFNRISTWQTAPQQGPFPVSIVPKSKSVVVKWSEIPPEKRGGCLQHYTIYLKDSAGKIQKYSVSHPQREYTITDLLPGQKYRLSVSAWTTAGESPIENERSFKLKHSRETEEIPLAFVISVAGAVFITCLCLLCLCQFSSVQRRFSGCCHCLIPSIVPDPANSKWAKECASDKGEMKLQLNLSDSSMSEEEPNTLEVEEFPQEKLAEDETISTEETQHPGKLQAESVPYQPIITSSYLKSFSNDSSSSDATQASRGTDITVDYISTHGEFSGGEEEEEEEDVDEEHKTFEFFPCPKSPFLGPLLTNGGKLTLDSVKIDCSDFLECG
ncbi:interleukin-12 receptor subunit beta-2 [Tachysurus vachellii]|uniref:interleukin-12 receptor subunit beta-2 n=1 Tax=Tachysurus vachellii TaxID=175792 RepID=UPI00296AFBEC|nr:interleukin-12 receptor subunit beta-2 [Tachysurus vachellii]